MTKLVDFDGDMIRLTPEGEKLAEDVRAGRVVIDDFFDKAIQNMLDHGLIERVGEDFQLTPKGKHVYHELSHSHDDDICAICKRHKRKDCDTEGWLYAIGPKSDDSYITCRPCPNKAPS